MIVAAMQLAACSGDGDGTKPGTTDPTTDSTPVTTTTDTAVPAEVRAVDCVRQANNTLRFDCAVQTNAPGGVRVRLLDGDQELATWVDAAVATEHTVTLWGMTPSATFHYEAWADESPEVVVDGDVTTGALPPELDLSLEITAPGSHDAKYVLFDWSCGGALDPEGLVIAREDGQVVWYQSPDPTASDNGFEGFSVTPEGTILALLWRADVVEWDLAGHLLKNQSLDNGGLVHFVHHGLERVNGYDYVLTAVGVEYPDGNLYAMDGFDVLDADGVVASWSSEGLLDPTLVGPNSGSFWGNMLGPLASDWSHANSISVAPSGEVYVSMRYINAVLKIQGDPADPAFGAVDWMLLGEATSEPYVSDFSLSSSGGVDPVNFGEQHHVSIQPDGDLLMWDNRPNVAVDTRALKVHVDPTTGVADLLQSWDSGQWCPGRGSAFILPNGNVLVDCSPADLVLELDASSAVAWSLHPVCNNGTIPDFKLTRAYPIDPYPKAE